MRPVIQPLRHDHHASPTRRPRYTDRGTPAHAVGLSFSVAPDVRPLPGSLVNVLHQGVRLLSRALTTAPGRPGAHRGEGWACAESAHDPSPVSAGRGFLGSRPFGRANALPAEQGAEPADGRLP